jgi:hypothetical protein
VVIAPAGRRYRPRTVGKGGEDTGEVQDPTHLRLRVDHVRDGRAQRTGGAQIDLAGRGQRDDPVVALPSDQRETHEGLLAGVPMSCRVGRGAAGARG